MNAFWTPRMRRRTERGAVAVIVGALLGFGVLLGASAIAVDVGNMMFERRQLQNGADATALKLAQACSKNAADCDAAARLTQLNTLASLNASDAAAQLDTSHYGTGQCGRADGGPSMPDCDVASGDAANLGQCPPLPKWLKEDPSIPYVETFTATKTAQGGSKLLSFFGMGNGSKVVACARAVWGAPGSTGTTFPLTISICDWYAATSGGFASGPPYTPAPIVPTASPQTKAPNSVSAHIVKILAHENGNPAGECGPSMNAPGGFGWLDDLEGSDDCRAGYKATGEAPGKPGGPPTNGCKNDGMQKYLGTEVLIPVFSSVVANGNNAVYTLSGVSSFYFAGWDNMQTASPNKEYGVYKPPNNNYCGTGVNAKTCIWGWFTSPILPLGTVTGSSPSRGPKTVSVVG